MELALAAVAEQLAYDFRELRYHAVVQVLTECVDEFPDDGVHFIEQAARARLALLMPGPVAVPLQRTTSGVPV
ncbi:MAG: hypothetical protein LPK36_04155 [Actinomycetes bacterium]|nr:hypothetical protein [Actinomycetes bacterium]